MWHKILKQAQKKEYLKSSLSLIYKTSFDEKKKNEVGASVHNEWNVDATKTRRIGVGVSSRCGHC